MGRGRASRGLMLVGLILVLIGLVNVLNHMLEIPRYWTPLLIGVVLLIVGAFWSAVGKGSGPS